MSILEGKKSGVIEFKEDDSCRRQECKVSIWKESRKASLAQSCSFVALTLKTKEESRYKNQASYEGQAVRPCRY
jgi:hypothetical protein